MTGYPDITVAHTVVECDTSTTQLVAANPLREYLLLQNITGSVRHWVSLGADGAAFTGIMLETSAAPSQYEISPRRGNLFLGAINAISESGSGNKILITEATGSGGLPTMEATNSSVSLATTSTLLLAANASRVYASFASMTAIHLYLKLGVAAVDEEGIFLSGANGRRFEMSAALGNLFTGAIYGLNSGTGSKACGVVEGVA
jgi:hypothetical protein